MALPMGEFKVQCSKFKVRNPRFPALNLEPLNFELRAARAYARRSSVTEKLGVWT